jgi:hypothetical protein
MKPILAGSLLVALLAAAVPASAGPVTITIHEGRVTLIADNATPREILREWARVGQTQIVNGERVEGPPITLRLENMPERRALDIVLKSAAGFMVAERPVMSASASMYDRILILATSTAVAAAPPPRAGAAPGRPQQPVYIAPVPPPADEVFVAEEPEPVENVEEHMTDVQMNAPGVSPYPGVGGKQPETNFDYANPQRAMQQRMEQELMQQQQEGQPAPPALFPGTTGAAGGARTGMPSAPVGSSARPGEVVAPPQTPPNPYTNPYNLGGQPGKVVQPTPQPDEQKYRNPYEPPSKQ